MSALLAQMIAALNSQKNKILIKKSIYNRIISSFSFLKEDGGILGMKEGVVCAFFFDEGDNTETYNINVNKLTKVVEKWDEEDIEFIGFIHSHPYGEGKPSLKDFAYLKKFMSANPKLKELHFPIVYKDENKVRLNYFIFILNEFKVVDIALID